MTPYNLLLLILATWWVSHTLANEQGPFNILTRFRARFSLGGLTTCIYCLSIWVAAILYIAQYRTVNVTHIAAIAGGALMLRAYTGAGMHGG